MNIVTHGLASLALARAAWPRAPKQLWIVAVAAGVIADIDLASAWWGAGAFLRWHRTYTHALLTTIVVAAVFAVGYRFIADDSLRARFSVAAAFALALAAACLHLLLDVCGWEGAALLWPFTCEAIFLGSGGGSGSLDYGRAVGCAAVSGIFAFGDRGDWGAR